MQKLLLNKINIYCFVFTFINMANIFMNISVLLSISVLFLQLVNAAKFLDITPLFLSTACLVSALSHSPVIVIIPLADMYSSL